jgi:16S rRNA (guanine1207-N2)-methyltransferase
MTPRDVLDAHDRTRHVVWRAGEHELDLVTKTGVRGAPGLDPALAVLAEGLGRGRAAPGGGALLDALGAQGAMAAYAEREGLEARVLVASAAARRVTIASGVDEGALVDGFAWDLPTASVPEVWWRPPGDRGTARLEAELLGWARAVAPDGVVWGVWHKDEGGNRAERLAASCFGRVEVANRASGWRLVALREPRPDAPAPEPWRDWSGPDGAMRTLVGTHAGARLDPGTALLLEALDAPGAPDLASARVLDLGSGSGVLARRAAERGAGELLALDDDLAAVRSTRAVLGLEPDAADGRSAAGGRPGAEVETGGGTGAGGEPGGRTAVGGELGGRPAAGGEPGGRPARVDWSDLLAGAPHARAVDVVLMNPPFHVGRQVVGELSRAFVAAALEALRPGGRLVLVANRALPYERDLAAWATWRDVTPANSRGFKVLDATAR